MLHVSGETSLKTVMIKTMMKMILLVLNFGVTFEGRPRRSMKIRREGRRKLQKVVIGGVPVEASFGGLQRAVLLLLLLDLQSCYSFFRTCYNYYKDCYDHNDGGCSKAYDTTGVSTEFCHHNNKNLSTMFSLHPKNWKI